MISELERTLAGALGTRLPAPLGGHVSVAPGAADSLLLVAVTAAEASEPDLGSVRPEVVPGARDPRSVVRMRCKIELDLRRAPAGARADQLANLDLVLHLSEQADMRSGAAFRGPMDPGFWIDAMRVVSFAAPLEPPDAPVRLTLRADGWFWPVGSVGASGPKIAEAWIRELRLPIVLSLAAPIRAGGPAVELALKLGPATGVRVGAAASAFAVDSLAVRLSGVGGVAKGSISGGAAGAGDARILSLDDGVATVTYQPPNEATTDELIIGMADPNGLMRGELARFGLPVGGP